MEIWYAVQKHCLVQRAERWAMDRAQAHVIVFTYLPREHGIVRECEIELNTDIISKFVRCLWESLDVAFFLESFVILPPLHLSTRHLLGVFFSLYSSQCSTFETIYNVCNDL